MPCATPPKYCACIAHGVKLIRMITLSCAWAAPASTSATTATAVFSIRIGTSMSAFGQSYLRCRVASLALPGDHAFDPRHESKERRADNRQRDDRRERARGVEVETAGENQIAEAVRGGEPFGDDRAEHRERGRDA